MAKAICAFMVVLIGATTASAEGAWVLCRQVTTSGHEVFDVTPWKLVQAVPTNNACEAAEGEVIKNVTATWQNAPGVKVAVLGETVYVRFPDAGGNLEFTDVWRFQCLPDTVDPSGPKGGPQ